MRPVATQELGAGSHPNPALFGVVSQPKSLPWWHPLTIGAIISVGGFLGAHAFGQRGAGLGSLAAIVFGGLLSLGLWLIQRGRP
jgi:hypothetical protein